MPAFSEWKHLYTRYERFLIPGALIVGIIADFITFRAINTETAFLLLTAHSIVAGTAIVLLHSVSSSEVTKGTTMGKYVQLALPLILQFSLGALLSASLVFYWFSGAFAISWPLFVGLLILMIGNDVFRDYYQMPAIQIPIYYFALFSFSSVALPYLTNSIEPWTFVLAGIISLIVITAYLFFASQFISAFRSRTKYFGAVIMCIYVFMHLLYFFNFIPPIPLSITDMDVYESVTRSGETYALTRNKESLIQRILPGTKITIQENGRVYLFSSIFAPADLNTTIVHDWEYYDETLKQWLNSSDISFSVIGGRSDGYRGYTYKQNHRPGKWRVTVRTERGQAMGRLVFRIDYANAPIDSVTRVE